MVSMVLRLRSIAPRTVVLPGAEATGAPRGGPAQPFQAWCAAVASAQADACFVLDAAGVIRAVSPPAAAMLGRGLDDLIEHWLLDVIDLVDFDEHDLPGDYADRLGPLLVLRSRGLMRGLLRIRRGDGRLVTFDCASAAVRDAVGAVVGSVSFLVDVSRR